MMLNRERRDGPKLRLVLMLLASTILISFFTLPIQEAFADPSIVQSKANTCAGTVSSCTLSLTNQLVSGNSFVIGIGYDSGAATCPTISTVTGGGFVFRNAKTDTEGTAGQCATAGIYLAPITASTSPTITVTLSGTVTVQIRLIGYEVSGNLRVSGSSSQLGTSCNSMTGTGSVSFGSPYFLMGMFSCVSGAGTPTAGTNFARFDANGEQNAETSTTAGSPTTFPITYAGATNDFAYVGVAFEPNVQVTLTLSPSSGSTSTSPTNCFSVTYTIDAGSSTICPPGVAAVTIYADKSTTITVSATTSGTTASEEWCTQIPVSSCTSVSFNSGTSATLSQTYVYYDLLILAASYSVIGGGSPTAPTLSYSTAPTSAGSSDSPLAATLSLTTASQNVFARRASTYSSTNPLGGSTSSERWLATSASGTASAVTSFTFAYYHQYACTCSYSISGGGSPTAPTIASTAFGVASTITLPSVAPATIFFDSGASYTVSPNPLTGSTSTQRWETGTTLTGTVSAAFTFAGKFYNQFLQTVSYSIVGGGSFTAPTFGYTTLGAPGTAPLTIAAQTVWADNNAPYSATNPLVGSTSSERAFSNAAVTGTISSAATLVFTYYRQISLQIKYTLDLSGPTNNPTFSITQYGSLTQYTNSLTSTTYWADYNQKFTAQTGWVETPGLKTEYAYPNAGTTVNPGPLIIAYRQASGAPSGSLNQLEQGFIFPSLLNTWSAPIGQAPWLAFVLLGINVAVYNKTQSVWISLIILMAAGGVFGYLLPVYVATIAQVFMYLGVAGIVVKAILRVL